MIIDLNEKYRLSTQDSNNIVLEALGTSKNTGEPYYTSVYYYSSLGSAMRSVLDDSKIVVDMETAEQFTEWLDKMKEIINQINHGKHQ
ncbi:MAG: hypothetical protein ABIH76_00750 [Candidatus Bathyarchaeota archaeon]